MWLRCLLFTQLLASRQGPGFEPHDGRMLWGSSLVAQMVKKLPAMRETQVPTLGQEDPLEEGMATDSSQYSRLENPPGGLQSTGWDTNEWLTLLLSSSTVPESEGQGQPRGVLWLRWGAQVDRRAEGEGALDTRRPSLPGRMRVLLATCLSSVA